MQKLVKKWKSNYHNPIEKSPLTCWSRNIQSIKNVSLASKLCRNLSSLKLYKIIIQDSGRIAVTLHQLIMMKAACKTFEKVKW